MGLRHKRGERHRATSQMRHKRGRMRRLGHRNDVPRSGAQRLNQPPERLIPPSLCLIVPLFVSQHTSLASQAPFLVSHPGSVVSQPALLASHTGEVGTSYAERSVSSGAPSVSPAFLSARARRLSAASPVQSCQRTALIWGERIAGRDQPAQRRAGGSLLTTPVRWSVWLSAAGRTLR